MRNHITNSFDTNALERDVVNQVDTRLRRELADLIIADALAARKIDPPPNDSAVYRRLQNAIASRDFPVDRGKVVDAVVRELTDIRDNQVLRSRVEGYAAKEEIPRGRFTAPIKEAMIAYLRDLGVQLDDDVIFGTGGYDEYLAIAYTHAIRTAGGSSDPIVAARSKQSAPWDFTVKYFDEFDNKRFVRNNILACAALDYTWYLGELLGVYTLAERVGDLWDNGVIDIESEEVQSMIFNYRENALQRPTPEQRGATYKRVLNLGGTKVMSGVVVNEEFPHLWHQLMAEVARYIQKREDTHEGSRLSRRPIVHAVEELQHNLSEFGSGGAGKQAQKLNAQLEDAMAILGADEVVEQLAFGRRKSVWRVIERLAKEERGRSVDVNALKILAEEGNRCFRFIANYSPAVSDEEFETFIDSAENWILAEASLTGAKRGEEESEGDELEDEPELELADEDAENAWA